MPLVRVEVRNEYGLGLPELYKEANKEDPKAVLDGVAVAGLVGILRQLGDLAEFAAEVFHGLQEEVMNTSSRSHKLMLRARHIETALPPLEKAVLSQKSHLHFAYTTGSNWCARVKTEHHHFIYSDLPQFLMDSYEESRGPPRLHLLDKFDPGGPGSCLKRYSDPSFFRRASRSDETKAEKVLRYKKARKIKKKRSWKRKEEESNAARASFNGRTQFASRDCDGQTSPSQTVSTHGATLKSETGGRSNSFDSKTESGYIECVFHPTNSIEPEEHESKEPSPSRSNTDTHNDNLLLDYEIRSNLSPEEICQTSSCVTWDEKTEILHLSGQQSDNEDISDMSPPMNFVLVSQEREVVNAVDHESASTSVSFANQIDDVESELDQFMDALNTIESESETDIDFKTNQETEQGLNLVEDGTLSLSVEHSDQNQLVFEFQAEDNSGSSRISSPAADNQITIHPDTFLNKEMSEEIHNPDIVAERSLNFTSSLENEINVESVDGNVSFSGSVDDHSLAPVNNGNPVHEGLTNVRNLTPVQRGCFQDLNPEPSGHNGTTVPLAPMNDEIKRTPCEPTGPVKFWTNGGLLGLEPSKPPDFSPLNSMRQDSVANPTRQSNVASSEIKKGEYSDYIWKTSSRISPAKIEKPHFNHSQGQGMADQENDSKGSSRIFELGNRFLVNGLGQKTSCSEEPVIYQTKDMFGRKSSYTSPSSSPPLEHMKLLFQPMERYETSKMKLKFPDESNGDTFRSFQLVPDPALPPRDIGSDSDDDDDTFCRSSPYMSDDCLSPSNSEQWESGESPNSNDFEIYDALRRISLTESVLNQFSENGVENHLHDLPSFDEEFINISEPNPVPPPLPPMEWRATKSILDTVAENQEAASETLNYALNVKLSGSTISQQPKPALLKRDGDIEPECTVKTKQPDWEKSNGLKEANQSASGKGMDEKEDFLHQIRTKSFNLRRTATARPPVTPNPTASAKVTAILEKANAIRQAVGSDDGEDEDTWSNT